MSPVGPSRTWPWMLTGCVLLPMMLYVWTASPGPYWLDSGEFVGAAWTLGIPHPPGHPLYTSLASGATLLPMGTIAWRVHLFSGFCAALSCAVLAWSLRRLFWRAGLQGLRAECAACVSALLAGSSYAIWFQSVRAEVYTLHLLSATIVVALALEMESRAQAEETADPRLLYGLALTLGLALANHHYLAIFLAMPVLVMLLARRIWRQRLLSWHGLRGCGFGFLGLATYAFLPLRALQDPLINWGDPSSPKFFWWVISARDFQKSLSHTDQIEIGDVFWKLGLGVMQQITPVGFVLALVGLVWLLHNKARRGVGLLLFGWVVTNLMTQSLFGTFDPYNPDAYGYFALSAWLLAMGCGIAWAWWDKSTKKLLMKDEAQTARVSRALSWAAVGLMTVLLGINIWLTLPRARLDGFRDVDVATAALLDPLPEGSLVLTSNYKTLFNLWYAQSVEHQRPDVLILHRNFFANEPYVAQVQRHTPAMVALMASPGENNRVNTAILRRLARDRDVFIEFDINIQPDLHPLITPEGLLFRVHSETLPSGPLPQGLVKRQRQHWLALEAQLKSRRRGKKNDPETSRHIIWQHYQMSRGLLASGRLALARFHLDRALAINSRSPELQELADKLAKRIQDKKP